MPICFEIISFCSLTSLGLRLGTEAPVMTPNGVDFSLSFFVTSSLMSGECPSQATRTTLELQSLLRCQVCSVTY